MLQTNAAFRTPVRARLLTALFGLVALLAGPAVHAAAPLCVATLNGGFDAHDDGLNPAMTLANLQPEGSTWEIRVRSGKTIQLTSDLVFDPAGDKDNKSFYLSGGWDSTCSNQTGKPDSSVIRGAAPTFNGYSTQMLFHGNNARYDISNIRFEDFRSFVINDVHCGDFSICPDTDTIRVERVVFWGGGYIELTAYDAKRVIFRNNLATALQPNSNEPTTKPTVEISINNSEDPPQVTFNTLNLRCYLESALLLSSKQPQLALHHNIVDTVGCPNDIFIFGGSSVTPYFNLFSTIGGNYAGDLIANGNIITTNVKFVDDVGGDYHLQNTSPAANGGASLLETLGSGFIVSWVDLDGNSRPFSTRFDMGAYESFAFAGTPPVITVNSTNDADDGICDSAHCSLREAINVANTQDGSDQRIVFDIPGNCPRPIFINSELPNITDSLTIDGYSEPGANENSLDFGSDANICVLISPGNTGVSHAFAVASGEPDTTRLVVRGLGFGNGFFAFGTDAIDLRGGSGHRIVGNAFGGLLPPAHNSALLGSLPRAVLVRGSAKNVKIGTPDAADRNYFGNLSQNGIVLNDATSTGHRIENNYIGVEPDGLTAQANQADGISASGGADVTIDGNTIAASDSGIALLGANTTNFTITRNNIGINALGIGNATLSNNVGITVAIGSSGHVIGAAATDDVQTGTYSNFIDNNLGDGILLAADAGPSNTIRGNAIGNNGRSGSGIGIDLGGSKAQLANDAGDPDSGPNALQNYPVIKGSTPVDASKRTVNALLNTTSNQALRIDFYQALACSSVKGADATNLVGSIDVNSGVSGVAKISALIVERGTSSYLTATATTSSGQTSELAPCVREDVIFTDGFD